MRLRGTGGVAWCPPLPLLVSRSPVAPSVQICKGSARDRGAVAALGVSRAPLSQTRSWCSGGGCEWAGIGKGVGSLLMHYTCGVCVAAGTVVRRVVCRGCEETRGNYTTSARRRCRTPSLRAPRRARRLAFRRPAPWFVPVAALVADARRRRPALVSRSREKPSAAAHRARPQLLSSARPQAADGRPAPLAYNCACANAASSFAPEDTVIEVCCIGLATSLPPSGAPRYGGMPNDLAASAASRRRARRSITA